LLVCDRDGFIGKYNVENGEKIWEMKYAPTKGTRNVFEAVIFADDGGLLVSGSKDSETALKELIFKSSGVFEDGTPFIGKISAADVAGDTAPSGFEWTYENDKVTGSTRSIFDDGGIVYGLSGTKTNIVKLTAAGAVTWNTEDKLVSEGQMNDLLVRADGADDDIYLAGHYYVEGGGILGRQMKVDASDGSMVYAENYGDYPGGVGKYAGLEAPKPGLVYHECWGIAENSNQDGFTIACGTGVEDCGSLFWGFKWGLWFGCDSDPRKAWRALTLGTDLEGERVWSRMDSFNDPAGGNGAIGSAGEYVITASGGGTIIVTDETMGLGFLYIDEYDDVKCAEEYESAWRISASVASAMAALYAFM